MLGCGGCCCRGDVGAAYAAVDGDGEGCSCSDANSSALEWLVADDVSGSMVAVAGSIQLRAGCRTTPSLHGASERETRAAQRNKQTQTKQQRRRIGSGVRCLLFSFISCRGAFVRFAGA